MNWIYVKSAKNKPLTLVDVSTRDVKNKNEYFCMNISEKMIEQGTPAKVPDNPFFQGFIALGELEQADPPKKQSPKKTAAK